jgi:hypothetical protein
MTDEVKDGGAAFPQAEFFFNVYPGGLIGPFVTLDLANAYDPIRKDRLGVVVLPNALTARTGDTNEG